ncbi:MAG: HAMP domain-containing sensor histidine kinase [Cyclobacteriaceae bacterium]
MKRNPIPFDQNRRGLALNLLLLQITICLGYLAYLLFVINITFTKFFLPTLILGTVVAVVLWIRKMYISAIIFDLLMLNIMLFFISERLSIYTGIDHYYVAIGAVALALFGYEHWKAGVGFGLLSLTLFILTRFVSFDAVPIIRYDEKTELMFFVINTVVASCVSIYCLVKVMKFSFESRKALLRTQATVEDQNIQLKKTNEELDRFVYSASHDLRSPLSSIKGLVNIIQIDKQGDREEYLKKIQERIEVMDQFIQEITNYSRNSRLIVSAEYFLMKPLVENVISSLRYADQGEQINFRMLIDDDLAIRSDPHRLRIILNNLISNAIKYADHRKDNPAVEISATLADSQVTITVKDNGIGIHAEHLKMIFNMFYRATEQSKGSGLGLYIAQEAVAKLKGEMGVTSEIDLGSTFSLIIPQ